MARLSLHKVKSTDAQTGNSRINDQAKRLKQEVPKVHANELPNETQQISKYISEMARRLRLPTAEAELIVAETEAHLQDRADDLVSQGMSHQEAERSATAEFGNPRRYARRLTDGFFASRSAFQASRAGRLMLFVTFAFLFVLTIVDAPFTNAINRYGLTDLVLVSFLAVAPVLTLLCGFRARRRQNGLITVFGLGLTLVTLASTGYYKTRLPNHELADRRKAQGQASFWKSQHDVIARELRLLDVGAAVYADGKEMAPVPADLRVGSLYLVPVAITGSAAIDIATGRFPLRGTFMDVTPKPGGGVVWGAGGVSSRAEAQLRWKRDAATWRAAKVKDLVRCDQEAYYLVAAANEPVVFSIYYFGTYDLTPVVITLILGALDSAGVGIGRRLFLARRKRRGRAPLTG